MTGYILKIGDSPVMWGSKKQKTVTLSTAEAEFVAACHTVTNVIWANMLIVQLLENKVDGPTLNIDNQSAISWIKNGQLESISKHIDVKYKFIFEKFSNKEFSLSYVPSELQEADIFTKPLARKRFEYLREIIGVRDLN